MKIVRHWRNIGIMLSIVFIISLLIREIVEFYNWPNYIAYILAILNGLITPTWFHAKRKLFHFK